MATRVLSATVDEAVAEKLDRLASATNRKKSYYVNAALKEYLEEIEDYDLALERKGGKTVTLEEAKRQLGM
jgi:predicted DNA-binding protein